MLALAHHYEELVAAPGGETYRARVYAGAEGDRWGAWIVFFPVTGDTVISTDRETTQSTMDQLVYWASGLTYTYLEGALERAISLQPEERLARELERLARLEASAEVEAETLEAAASIARTETKAATVLREQAEDDLLAARAARKK